ncbi:FKBP-type peptidyl-prolyl cis-trans isomerase [Novipirellula artificiosorum]|uniref:Peptidyl-prolyl cis-trans isomerase n=1 Tax=Novipirellula artificiosorum TaxID=2528016 RepID=A0A5C6D8C4_9BACT|nr:FKBP-type peptidyl-prolyl cis-trans isomerase [Novipirellula artificiosorum]TWU33038.1 putative FKBP-type peptidyl-prolyl cis-trans isomerase [Novipirellula artificiosorum]
MLKHLFLTLTLTAIPAFAIGQETVKEDQPEIKAGPDDSQEKVKPGPIDKDAPREFKKTDSGLKFRILRKSDQPKPKATDAVEVHYKGWLDDKKIFDSSYRRAEKISFPLRGVIAGWTEGMQLVGEGGMIELEIPGELGYGRRGMPGAIPPNATLHFIVELFDVK